jgi:protein-S-isoprenylcysteine O-methyltransferase Ste14
MVCESTRLLWYVPVISVTGVVHLFVDRWRSYGVKSYYLLYAMGLVVFAATAFAMPYLLRVAVPMPTFLVSVGVVLLLISLGFLFWAYKALSWRHLAWFYELTHHARSTGEPVRRGPYRFCRHPIYSAASLIMIAAFLSTGVASLAILFIMLLALTACEERELRTRYGAAYSDYSRQVPLFLFLRIPSSSAKEGTAQRVTGD